MVSVPFRNREKPTICYGNGVTDLPDEKARWALSVQRNKTGENRTFQEVRKATLPVHAIYELGKVENNTRLTTDYIRKAFINVFGLYGIKCSEAACMAGFEGQKLA